MTATLNEAPLTSVTPLPRRAGAPSVAARADQHVLIQDPPDGTVVRMSVACQLVLRFRTRVGASRWRAAHRPDHVVQLAADGHELCFLIFDGEPARMLLERADPDTGQVHETRDLLVIPTQSGLSVAARTPRSGARRSA